VVSRDIVAAKAGRARVWLNDAATTLHDSERVHREAHDGIPALRSFLLAVTTAAGL